MEDLKATVNIKAKDLTEGFVATPLREFIGTLENYEAERDERFDRVRVTLQFKDVEVIETTEAYPFPIAQLPIPFSTRKLSAMGFLVKSIELLIPDGSLNSLLKRRIRMKIAPENYGRWRGETEDRVRDTWKVVGIVEVSPAASASAYETAVKMLAGHSPDNLQQYYHEALTNPVVKSDREVVAKLLSGKIAEEAVADGKITVEDGRFKIAQS